MASIISTLKKSIKNWWLFLLVGILFIAIGGYTFSRPLASYLALSLLFGWLIFITGVLRTTFAISNRKALEGWGWTLATGILDMVLGFILFFHPDLSMLVLAFVVGFYVLLAGAGLITYAIDLRAYGIKGWGWLIVGGVLVGLFGLLVIFNPLIGAITLVGWTGFAFIVAGVFHCLLAFQARKVKRRIAEMGKD
ncbi:HdeD family acid-resistance protein [Parapedobacter koreensis]|uniref:Uncharacterized membrane protein HdeD, DUF308 family n=1 Tax=Parapedobacter koreensis TaxID=332977 RepID=A0A1H7RJC9_9SPHI|nr:DUF308 domain-containing protein [Parapedobacter koreensis]SEL60303.1 Uncharacterized membrane protein HdeD, DUF308 family [Parapedobacter koreensis]